MEILERVQAFEADVRAQNNMIIRIDTTLEVVRNQVEGLLVSVNGLMSNLNRRLGELETRVTVVERALEARCDKREKEIELLSEQVTHLRLSQAKFAGICAACSALGASFPFIFNYFF